MISTLFMKTTNNSTMNGTISRKSSMENVRQRRRSEEFAPVSIEKRFSFLNPKNFFHRTITPKKELQEVSVAEKHRPKMRKLSLQAKGSVLSLLKRRRNSIISTIKCVSSDDSTKDSSSARVVHTSISYDDLNKRNRNINATTTSNSVVITSGDKILGKLAKDCAETLARLENNFSAGRISEDLSRKVSNLHIIYEDRGSFGHQSSISTCITESCSEKSAGLTESDEECVTPRATHSTKSTDNFSHQKSNNSSTVSLVNSSEDCSIDDLCMENGSDNVPLCNPNSNSEKISNGFSKDSTVPSLLTLTLHEIRNENYCSPPATARSTESIKFNFCLDQETHKFLLDYSAACLRYSEIHQLQGFYQKAEESAVSAIQTIESTISITDLSKALNVDVLLEENKSSDADSSSYDLGYCADSRDECYLKSVNRSNDLSFDVNECSSKGLSVDHSCLTTFETLNKNMDQWCEIGDSYPDILKIVSKCYRRLGAIYGALKDYERGKDAMEMCICLLENNYTEQLTDSIDLAGCYAFYALLLERAGDLALAKIVNWRGMMLCHLVATKNVNCVSDNASNL